MTIKREQQIDLSVTPYYHCINRCVRRAFLCGDAYEHRRQWVEDKLLELAEHFCIDYQNVTRRCCRNVFPLRSKTSAKRGVM